MNLEMSLEELLDKIFPLPKLEDNIAYTYADRAQASKPNSCAVTKRRTRGFSLFGNGLNTTKYAPRPQRRS